MFYLFAYQAYEASGGLRDLIGAFPTLETAEQRLFTLDKNIEFAHIGTIDADGDLIEVRDYWRTNYVIEGEDHTIFRGRSTGEPARWLIITEAPNEGYTRYKGKELGHA